jgi:hypothetical protein
MGEAIGKTLVDHFEGIEDPRIDRRKLHNLQEIIVIAICASVAHCNGFEEIAMFAESHEEWFRKFLKLENGIPSHDTFERVFARINPKQFRSSFASWTGAVAGVFADVIPNNAFDFCIPAKPCQTAVCRHLKLVA